jgi:hypothetical protein
MVPHRRFLSARPLSNGHLHVQCCIHSVDAAIIVRRGNDALLFYSRREKNLSSSFFFSFKQDHGEFNQAE